MNHEAHEHNGSHYRHAVNMHKLAEAGLPAVTGCIVPPAFFGQVFTATNDDNSPLQQQILSALQSIEADLLKWTESTGSNAYSASLCYMPTSNEPLNSSEANELTTFKYKDIESFSHVICNAIERLADNVHATHSSLHDGQFSLMLESIPSTNALYSGLSVSRDVESGFEGVIIIQANYGHLNRLQGSHFMMDEYHVSKQALTNNKQCIIQRNLGQKTQSQQFDAAMGLISQDTTAEQRLQFCLDDQTLCQVARLTQDCEQLMGQAIQTAWLIDGDTRQCYIAHIDMAPQSQQRNALMERFLVKESGDALIEGRSIGQRIASGKIRIITDRRDIDTLQQGEVLVTDMTDPDWERVIDKAAAIITNRGGRTCHAAIIARELGVPAIVGCINATQTLMGIDEVTVSCAEGDTGYVYEGSLEFSIGDKSAFNTPQLPVEILMNVGNPDKAYEFQSYPNNGVGLARLEFIINRMIGIHPQALLNSHVLNAETQAAINVRMTGFDDSISFFKAKLMEGVSTIAAAFSPKKVIVRLSDFKSNEYSHLIGGHYFEPKEENPMLGFRGVSRYLAEDFKACFELECQALKAVRDEMGFDNIELMVPFCRTLGEARQVIELMAENGLVRGVNGLRIIMMCEIPANAILAEQFLQYFDGFSIGSNDLTQMTLGLDRDSELVAHLFDERNDAVKALFTMAIDACKKQGKTISVCGQAPSEHPDLAQWFVQQGVDSLSLNPDAVLDTLMHLNKHNTGH